MQCLSYKTFARPVGCARAVPYLNAMVPIHNGGLDIEAVEHMACLYARGFRSLSATSQLPWTSDSHVMRLQVMG
jgi:hypothetical protein